MKIDFKLLALLCLLAGALAACETIPAPKPIQRPGQILSLEEISQALALRQEIIHNVKSLVKTRIKTPEDNHTLKQILLIDGETALRLDTLNLFNQPVSVLICKPDQILLFDTDSNKLYRGTDVWDIMVRTFGTVFDFREYAAVFSGKIPRWAELQLKNRHWSSRTGNYHIQAEDPSVRERLEIEVDPQGLHPVRMTKRRDGKVLYVVEWEDYRKLGSIAFPHVIRVSRPLHNDSVEITFNNPLINRGVPEDAFQLNIPKSN